MSNNQNMRKHFLTIEQAADVLDMPNRTFRRLIENRTPQRYADAPGVEQTSEPKALREES